jgi:hypothetical protein
MAALVLLLVGCAELVLILSMGSQYVPNVVLVIFRMYLDFLIATVVNLVFSALQVA